MADPISRRISTGKYKMGDALPSINQLSQEYKVSRDTVFKAFINLKERGIKLRLSDRLQRYRKLILCWTPKSMPPRDTCESFKKFCADFHFESDVAEKIL